MLLKRKGPRGWGGIWRRTKASPLWMKEPWDRSPMEDSCPELWQTYLLTVKGLSPTLLKIIISRMKVLRNANTVTFNLGSGDV